MTWRSALAAAAALVLSSAAAAGQPTLWERARTPRSIGIYRAELAVERMLMRIEDAEGDPSMQRDLALGALAMLELVGGVKRDGPRLGFLLGRLLASDSIRRDEEAVPILERLVATSQDALFVGEACYYLARADARLGRVQEAWLSYRRALDLVWDPDLLALTYLYRGELEMRLHHLADAKESFRAALAQTTKSETVARSYLALAAALERLGDLPSALEAAATAAQIPLHSDVHGDRSILDVPAADLEPSYEAYYRVALARMALADRSDSPDAAHEHVAEAIDAWNDYLGAAGSVAPSWSAHAIRLREACRRGSLPFVPRPTP
ncbi:MAG: tetratricopeptide repeat protein [Polyangiaceae bacterium]|nr:tetratricopeptide repeat protein [Polyangiaceae bacterium]